MTTFERIEITLNMWAVLELFRSGMDTIQIASRFSTRECLVCDALFHARQMERQVRVSKP